MYKYIEAATKLDQLGEVERVCRENEHYEVCYRARERCPEFRQHPTERVIVR